MVPLVKHEVEDLQIRFTKVNRSFHTIEGLYDAKLRISRDLDQELWSLLGRIPRGWMEKVLWKEGARKPRLGQIEYEYVLILGRGTDPPYYTYAYAYGFSDPKFVACDKADGELRIVRAEGQVNISSYLDIHELRNLVERIGLLLSKLPE